MSQFTSQTLSEQGDFARRLLTVLAGEGKLQGEFELSVGSVSARIGEGDYYIEDVFTRVPSDAKLLKARLRDIGPKGASKSQVLDAASFAWIDDEIRERFRHFFKLQPFNTLLWIEGALSYEDVKSASPTPLWGSISFYSGAKQLDRAFVNRCDTQANELLNQAVQVIRGISRKTVRPRGFLPPIPKE